MGLLFEGWDVRGVVSGCGGEGARRSAFTAKSSRGSVWPPSAQTSLSRKNLLVSRASSTWAASRSVTFAAVTMTVSSSPVVSTTMRRSRPLIFFPPSKPREAAGTDAAALTDWESMMPAVGSGSRPAAARVFPHNPSWNSLTRPLSRRRRKST